MSRSLQPIVDKTKKEKNSEIEKEKIRTLRNQHKHKPATRTRSLRVIYSGKTNQDMKKFVPFLRKHLGNMKAFTIMPWGRKKQRTKRKNKWSCHQ